jgi:hypothetical protein
VYGEKAEEMPPVGDGTRGLFKAITVLRVGGSEVDREVTTTKDYICPTTPRCRMCRVVWLLSDARRRSL